MQTIKIG